MNNKKSNIAQDIHSENGQDEEKKLRVLISAPVHQDAATLQEYLNSIANLDISGLDISCFFIDDNSDAESKLILRKFATFTNNVTIFENGSTQEKRNNSFTHIWSQKSILKVTAFRNLILKAARIGSYDYLFTIDSDILLHPKTLVSLIKKNKNIISEVFWTKWTPDSIELPQVWVSDHYSLYESEWCSTQLKEDEIRRRIMIFLKKLRTPGVYKVGGLGACTLISKAVLNSPISYDKIPNLSFWGEDRHFCVRAAVLGFELYADTHYPAFHIYRTDYLPQAKKYEEQHGYNKLDWDLPVLNFSELMKDNESGRLKPSAEDKMLIDMINKYLDDNDIEKAYDAVLQYEKQLNAYEEYWTEKAAVCIALKGYDIALECLAKSLNIAPKNPDTFENIGYLYQCMNMPIMARQYETIASKMRSCTPSSVKRTETEVREK